VNLIVHLIKRSTELLTSVLELQATGVHLRAREFGALPDDLLNGIEEVTFCSDLAPRTYSKHPSLDMISG
jgi:hypothetical protein